MGRKEGRGGRKDEESEKVVKMKKSLKEASLASLGLVSSLFFPLFFPPLCSPSFFFLLSPTKGNSIPTAEAIGQRA